MNRRSCGAVHWPGTPSPAAGSPLTYRLPDMAGAAGTGIESTAGGRAATGTAGAGSADAGSGSVGDAGDSRAGSNAASVGDSTIGSAGAGGATGPSEAAAEGVAGRRSGG